MLLKYTVYTVAAIAVLAEVSEARRRRKGGKKGGKGKAAAAATPAAVDDIFSDAMTGPGAEEIFASLSEDPFENMDEFLSEFGDDDEGFRGVGGGFGEEGFRAVTLQQIMNAGGPEYCRDMSKIHPNNRPKPGQPGYTTWREMMDKCGELNSVMAKRKAACHHFLMKVVYNPNRKYDLKPMEQTRFKYCHDITKLRNPWLTCTRKCPKGKKGRYCVKRKSQCNNNLKIWNANNEALKESKGCRKLPVGMKTPPPPNHPANNKRKCVKGKRGKWNCENIPGSDLPWCPFGWTEATKDQSTGKGKGSAWGKGGKKPKGKKPKKNGNRSIQNDMDPNSEKFQAMVADMENIESQFGHAALNKEITKFQNKKKNNKGRTSYEEAVALSYTDDEVMN